MDEFENPTTQIVDAVAEAEGVESVTLEPPLAEVVDPDAVETLIEDSTAPDLDIHFAYRGHDVVVDENGHVQVE
jgi:hypothetical protein